MATQNYPTAIVHALELLRANPDYVADARNGGSIAGLTLASLLEVPRPFAEQAIHEAIDVLDREAASAPAVNVVKLIAEALTECALHVSQHEITSDAGAERLARCLQLRLAARGWVLEPLKRAQA